MPLTAIDNARNRVQVLANLVFLMASQGDLPDWARAYLAQVQSEVMLLSQLLSPGREWQRPQPVESAN